MKILDWGVLKLAREIGLWRGTLPDGTLYATVKTDQNAGDGVNERYSLSILNKPKGEFAEVKIARKEAEKQAASFWKTRSGA